MIPIEYLWYIIGAVSVPVFILIYLKALKRNRADKARVALRRKRFERTMKSPPARKSNTGRLPSTDDHWLRRIKTMEVKPVQPRVTIPKALSTHRVTPIAKPLDVKAAAALSAAHVGHAAEVSLDAAQAGASERYIPTPNSPSRLMKRC